MLLEAQNKLEKHYASLRDERASLRLPVYALEHGFGTSEIENIRQLLNQDMSANHQINRAHWLLWIAFAAEVGYSFDGDEYWDSFERLMPGWWRYGSRKTIQRWFKVFANQYTGFTPSGRWANTFTIICWPIAHSILPRDLQFNFAKCLFDIRYELANIEDFSPSKISSLLRSKNTSGSSRFYNFLEQEDLTAHLIIAFRDEDISELVSPISRITLKRILQDLEQRQSGRTFLNAARNVLRSARLKTERSLIENQITRQQEQSPNQLPVPGPKLIARQTNNGEWIIGFRFSDFKELINRQNITYEILDKTRVSVPNSEGWRPGRTLINLSDTEYPIVSFEAFLKGPLLTFENTEINLNEFIAFYLHFLSKGPWLLRVHDDGAARQVIGNHIRTGESYIYISETDVLKEQRDTLSLIDVQTKTIGVYTYYFQTPTVLKQEYIDSLNYLKLGYKIKARIDPIGLVPRRSGLDQATIWLPHEEILLRLSAECDLIEFRVILNNEPPVSIKLQENPSQIISLGHLPIGHHIVIVNCVPKPSLLIRDEIENETFSVIVRSPIPWIEGIATQAGFSIQLSPPEASLEELLLDKAKIKVIGPPDRVGLVEIHTFDINGHQKTCTSLGDFKIPMSERSMTNLIHKITTEPLAEEVNSSNRVDIAFIVEELGKCSISLSSVVKPLRWKSEQKGDEQFVRLIDDTGAEANELIVEKYDVNVPDDITILDLETCTKGFAVPTPGMLLTAKHKDKNHAALLSVPQTGRISTFQDLNIKPRFSETHIGPSDLPRILRLWSLWNNAQLLGKLAGSRKMVILQLIEEQILKILCGSAWGDLVKECISNSPQLITRLKQEVQGYVTGFSSQMSDSLWQQYWLEGTAISKFRDLTSRYDITSESDLSDLALMFAFDIPLALTTYTQLTEDSFDQLIRNKPLCRGAYLARIASQVALITEAERIAS